MPNGIRDDGYCVVTEILGHMVKDHPKLAEEKVLTFAGNDKKNKGCSQTS